METPKNGNAKKWKRQKMETPKNSNARKWQRQKMETPKNGNARKENGNAKKWQRQKMATPENGSKTLVGNIFFSHQVFILSLQLSKPVMISMRVARLPLQKEKAHSDNDTFTISVKHKRFYSNLTPEVKQIVQKLVENAIEKAKKEHLDAFYSYKTLRPKSATQ
jgi:hypothetical protein